MSYGEGQCRVKILQKQLFGLSSVSFSLGKRIRTACSDISESAYCMLWLSELLFYLSSLQIQHTCPSSRKRNLVIWSNIKQVVNCLIVAALPISKSNNQLFLSSVDRICVGTGYTTLNLGPEIKLLYVCNVLQNILLVK